MPPVPLWAQLLIGLPVIAGLTILVARVISPPQYEEEDVSCDCDRYTLYPTDEARQRQHRELVDAVLEGDDWAARRLHQYMRMITSHPECWFSRGDTVLKADFRAAWQRAVEVAREDGQREPGHD